MVTASATLNVDPFYSYTAELKPGQNWRLGGGLLPSPSITASNVQVTFSLEGRGLGENLRLRLESGVVIVAPGVKGEVSLTVAAVRRPLAGKPITHDFGLSISADAGNTETLVVSAQTEALPGSRCLTG